MGGWGKGGLGRGKVERGWRTKMRVIHVWRVERSGGRVVVRDMLGWGVGGYCGGRRREAESG